MSVKLRAWLTFHIYIKYVIACHNSKIGFASHCVEIRTLIGEDITASKYEIWLNYPHAKPTIYTSNIKHFSPKSSSHYQICPSWNLLLISGLSYSVYIALFTLNISYHHRPHYTVLIFYLPWVPTTLIHHEYTVPIFPLPVVPITPVHPEHTVPRSPLPWARCTRPSVRP